MFESGANHSKILENILQAANKHPNSRVSKLIHSVEEERSQKNIVLLLIELAEHPEYCTDFGISLRYYLDLFEQLGIGRDIVLNEAGLLLLNSSKVYARRVDFVQELVERQILTLSNTEKEMVENRPENAAKSSTEKPKRTRKRLVEAIDDPYEVQLVPRKFRKLTEDKRFGGTNQSEKTKVTASKFYRIESEQYIHPAAWMHTSIVDLENEEDIDSKRNYKLFTYHVEHRYNTLVPDINFRLHFKVKDYIDEEEERLAEIDDHNAINAAHELTDWPPLSEEYIQKYLDLENKVLDIGEILRHRKKPRLDDIFLKQRNINKIKVTSQEVQNAKGANESNIECNRDLSQSINESTNDFVHLDSGIDTSVSLNNTSSFDISTNANESGVLLEVSSLQEGTINCEADLSITNLTAPNCSLDLTQNLNSTEKSLLECTNETEKSIDASNITTQDELTDSNVNENSSCSNEHNNDCTEIATQELRNDTGLGESINEHTTLLNESNKNDDTARIVCSNENCENLNENPSIDSNKDDQTTKENEAAEATCDKQTEKKATENEDASDKIRVYLPHLDDEGVFFSDLDDHEQRMLSPKVLTTDVFPCIPNKEKITIYVDDEIKTLLNIVEEDEPPITYTMPVQILPPTPPLVLNIFKFHEKILRRRLLFKLGPEMDNFLQSRSMKRTHCVDMNETRQYRPMKLFSDSPDVTAESKKSGLRCASSAADCNNVLSDDEDAEDFLGFTEEEQANKMTHRLSRDSGVDDAEGLITPSYTCTLRAINEDFNEAITQLQERKNIDDSTEKLMENGEQVEENVTTTQKHIESSADVIDEPEIPTDTTMALAATTTTVITNDVVTNDSSTAIESTETPTTALIENTTLSENVAAIIDEINTTIADEMNVADDTTFREIDTNANTANETNIADDTTFRDIDDANTNTANEINIDDDTMFRDSVLFTQDDLLDMDNLQEVEKSKSKIQKWHEYLQPILSKARDRHHFDVFQLGTEIMNELQNPSLSTRHITTSSITFQNVMTDKDESYVSRYFLSTLLLANQNNIQINVKNKCTEKPSDWDDIQLNLLDTKRHTVAIEDNIGIINTKALSTTDTTKRKQKKSSIINEAGCSSSSSSSNAKMDESLIISNELLNVNINAVRPLKQIEKLPNANDDYDSGIFSNEECMS